MNATNKKSLKAWIQQNVLSEDRRKVGKVIRAYVRRHPEAMTIAQTWPDILRMAESSGVNPRDVSTLQKKRAARERAAQIRAASGRNPRHRRNAGVWVVQIRKRGGSRSDAIEKEFETRKAAGDFAAAYRKSKIYHRPHIFWETKPVRNPAELLIMGANPRVEVVHADNPPVEDIVEDFTGQEVKWLDVYNEPHIPRGRYAQLGPLIALYIKPAAGGQVQRIGGQGENFAAAWAGKPPIIVTDSSAKQIYFVDGAQDISASLAAFGAIDRGNGLVELGQGRRIDYQCRKEHVASPDEDLWKHDHGEENGALPTVLFDTRNKRLLYEGGDYRIEGPWIRN